jgi:putative acetyltransferase
MKLEPSSSAVVIREARPDEMGLVRELFVEYAQSLGFDLGFQGFEEEVATLPGKYARPMGRLLLALCGEEPAGCVGLRPFDARRCEMKRLYVRPAYRGRGIGEALLGRFLKEARGIEAAEGDLGSDIGNNPRYRSVVLDTIEPLMLRAVAMYKKAGFREIPPYRPNPLRGAVYLELALDSPSGGEN